MNELRRFARALVLTLILSSLYGLNGYKLGYPMYFLFGFISTLAIGKGK